MTQEQGLGMRMATIADARLLWAWRNDPASRAASLDGAEIPYGEHEAWLAAALVDPARTLLIGVLPGGESVGMVRFDRFEGGETRVSINLAPEWRGRGLGTALLRLAVATRADERLRAEVRAANAASLRLFERCGFACLSEGDGVVALQRG
jgi:RimJ/RimL family protein N-acetyltransferase